MATYENRKTTPTMTEQEKSEIVGEFKRYINKGQVSYLKAGHLDVIETNRKGIHFTDPQSGRIMIDAFSSAGCFNVGRHNKEILAALTTALDQYDMGNHNLLSPIKIAYAKKMVEIVPGDLNKIIFAAGGGDAVDAAIKLARGATKKSEIISTIKAYHGHTGFALSANGKEHYRHYCEPLMPDFKFVPFNDLSAMESAITDKTAAIIIEPIQGEAGVFIGDTDYLKGLRVLCDKRDILLIFDEIQTGFGRTGKLFALEHSGVIPDILTLAKSLGGGTFANAAVMYRDLPVLCDYINKNPDFHPSATGGSDLGAAVSLAVIEYVTKNKLSENAQIMGAKLKNILLDLMHENPKIVKDVRGIGMMMGIEYIHEFMGPMMADALAKHGVFAAYSGNAPQVMRFMIPITASDMEIDEMGEAIKAALKDMKIMLPLALTAVKIPIFLKLINSEKVQTRLFGFIRVLEDATKKVTKIFKRGAK